MRILSAVGLSLGAMLLVSASSAQSSNLATSKQLTGTEPGAARKLNSLPVSMAVSPDGRYVVTVNAGYGTWESGYRQSLSVLNTGTGELKDFREERTSPVTPHQTLNSGLAFSADGRRLYATIASTTDAEAEKKGSTGNGILVYQFEDGAPHDARLIRLPLRELEGTRRTLEIGDRAGTRAVPYPAALAVVSLAGKEKLLVAENLADDVLVIDVETGAAERRFDLTESDAVPGTYPIALLAEPDGKRAFVALWNSSEIAELDLSAGKVGRKLALLKPEDVVRPGSHPCAFALAPDAKTLYVALANRDAVAAVDVSGGQLAVKGYFDTRLPHQTYFGAEPVALALDATGTKLYAADMALDAVAVFDAKKLTAKVAREGMVEPEGFIPTEWLPISMAAADGRLYVATGKGKGTGPNGFPQHEVEGLPEHDRNSTYIGTLLYGSLAVVAESDVEKNLTAWTRTAIEANRLRAAEEKIAFAGGANPIKHVIYIIKENRTYDQILGDLEQNGKPVGNGDKSLTMYGAGITPNEHKLALQFGVLDNFFDSGEVSGDGHVWSTAAIGTDYLEKTWQQQYRSGQRTYDYEGVVANGLPLAQKIADVNEPASGYLWGNLARHGKSYLHFGEYIATTFCDEKKTSNPQMGPMLAGMDCARGSVKPGEALPEAWGGGANKFAWPIPLIAKNVPTKPELVGHFVPESPDFNLMVPDQIRVDIFLKHLDGWIADWKQGKDTMPNFVLLRLGDDHTAGTRPGEPTPKASIADNDLAVGRAVAAISHSPLWDSTAFFILEDDAQAGADHVDAHRSIALVVSKYAPHAKDGGAMVDSRFYSTVSVIRTMETLLGLPPMNQNDAFSSMISTLFTGPGDQAPFVADTVNRDNGLIYKANEKTAAGARESMKMDFRHADRADTQKLNLILWKDAMGAKPVPAQLLVKRKKSAKDDDD